MANLPVFNSAQQFGGSFSSKHSQVAFGGYTAGHLAQQVQFQYQQQVTMMYELGSSNVYYVGGRAQGTATISKLVGPQGLDVATLFNDICSPSDIVISTVSGCTKNLAAAEKVSNPASVITRKSGKSYGLQNAVLTALAGNQTAQDVVFTETLSFMFLNLWTSSETVAIP